MDTVVAGRVHDPLDRPELADQLCVDPVLVERLEEGGGTEAEGRVL